MGGAAAAGAQSRGAMGVSVTVVRFAPNPTISGTALSAPRRRAGGASSVEMQSRLSIRSARSYTLNLRTDGDTTGATDAGILVRTANGRFQRVTSGAAPVVTDARGSSDERVLDIVVRVDSARSSTQGLVAELVAARLDQ